MTTRARPRRRGIAQLVTAICLPLLTALALTGVRTSSPSAPIDEPSLTELTRVSLACPGTMNGGSAGATRTVFVLSSTGQDGSVTATVLARSGQEDSDQEDSDQADSDQADSEPKALDLQADRPATARLANPVVITGRDAMAPGLEAARLGEGAGVACAAPTPQAWFPGVGARPAHASTLQLTNPDPGPAIADITVLAPSGPVDAPSLRGIRVSGNTSTTIDLAEVVPRRTELSVQVVVSRGRLSSALLNRVETGDGKSSLQDWLAPAAEPAESGLLLGLPTGTGSRRLTLANPGTDETAVTVKIVSAQSTFTPEGFPEISVPPGASRSVELSALLEPLIEDGASGLLIETAHPVAAALRSTVDGDLTHTVTLPAITGQATALVPRGTKKLTLSGAEGAGTVVLRARGADGDNVQRRRIEIDAQTSTTVRLPKAAVSVTVGVQDTSVRAAVLVEADGGAMVLGLEESMLQGLVPAVRPSLN